MLIPEDRAPEARTALSLSSHCDMCVRKELPFAGYSVVKEQGPGRAWTLINRGGEYRARTGDLLVANQALSQLS
jgi:hypothetical protein